MSSETGKERGAQRLGASGRCQAQTEEAERGLACQDEGDDRASSSTDRSQLRQRPRADRVPLMTGLRYGHQGEADEEPSTVALF